MFNTRQNNSDGIALLFGQSTSCLVRLIIQLFHYLIYFLTGLITDISSVIQTLETVPTVRPEAFATSLSVAIYINLLYCELQYFFTESNSEADLESPLDFHLDFITS